MNIEFAYGRIDIIIGGNWGRRSSWKEVFNAACYGIKRFLEPYFMVYEEKVKAKTELTESEA